MRLTRSCLSLSALLLAASVSTASADEPVVKRFAPDLLARPALAARANVSLANKDALLAALKSKGALTRLANGYRWTRGDITLDLLDREKAWTAEHAGWVKDALDLLPDLYIKKAIRGGMHRIYRDGVPSAPWQFLEPPSPTLSGVAVPPAPWHFVALGDRCFRDAVKCYDVVIHELGHCVQWDLSGWGSALGGTPGFTGISWTTGIPGIGLRSYNGFVSEYARKTAQEDFAECCEYYWLDPDALREANPAKFAFIRDVVFEGLAPPAAARVDRDLTERVRPIVTSLGDSEDDQYAHVTVRGTYFMGPLDGGFNAVRYRGTKTLHVPVSRSTIHSWVPGIATGQAGVTVTTQDGTSDPHPFKVTKPWWKFW